MEIVLNEEEKKFLEEKRPIDAIRSIVWRTKCSLKQALDSCKKSDWVPSSEREEERKEN